MNRPLAVTILTNPIPTGLERITRLKKWARHNLSALIKQHTWPTPMYGGHAGVTRSILTGFKKIGVRYNYNPLFTSQLYERVIVLAGIDTLKQAILYKQQGKIKKLFAGPNIFLLFSDDPSLSHAPEIDYLIANSTVAKSVYETDSPELGSKIRVWPAGVDPTFWKPTTKKDSHTVLFYYKTGPKELYSFCKNLATGAGLTVIETSYGSYRPHTFRSMLDAVNLAVFFSESESQGLALLETWSMNVPTLVWNRGLVTYPSGRAFPGSGAPYLTDKTGMFFKTENDFQLVLQEYLENKKQFEPRNWVLEHMTDEKSAELMLSLIRETVTRNV